MKKAKIYFTSDTHGYLLDTNYQNKDKLPLGVLQATKNFKKDGNTLILDGGDTIQGSPLAKICSEKKDPLIAQVFNQCNYDYVTLGNHDFNYGYDMLQKHLDSLNALCVVANVIDITNQLPLNPFIIHTLENGLKIGIVGIATDYLTVWEDPKHLEKIEVLDAFEQAKKYLEEIKNQCDITICLYHGGFEANLQTGEVLSHTKENVGYKITQELDFDILLTSHQHMPTSFQKVGNSYVVQNLPSAASFVAIDINIENGKKIITGSLEKTQIEDFEVLPKLKQINDDLQIYLDSNVGTLNVEMVKETKIETALKGSILANMCNMIQLDYSNADISCTALSNDCIIFDQEISVRNIISAFPFPNTIVVLEVTKDIIKQALERVSEYFDVINNEVVVSKRFVEPKIEHFNFDFFMGIDYTIDVTKPLGQRVTKILFKGQELESNKTYTLAMNNYRATGTGGYEFYKECKVVKEYGVDIQEVIIDYIKEKKQLDIPNSDFYKVIF